MSEVSSNHLESFILSSPTNFSPVSTSTACDFLLIRLISNGQFLDAVRLSRKLDDIGENGIGTKLVEENSSSIEQREIDNDLKRKLREKRRLLLDGAMKVLPNIELELLKAELEFGSNQDITTSTSSGNQGKEMEVDGMGMSWENVDSNNQSQNASTPVKSKVDNSIVAERLPLSASPSRSKSSSPALGRNRTTGSPSNTSITNHETLLHSVLRATRDNADRSRQISSPLRPRGSGSSIPATPKVQTSSASIEQDSTRVDLNDNNGDVSMISGIGSEREASDNRSKDQESLPSSTRPDASITNQPVGFLARNNLSLGSSTNRSPINHHSSNQPQGDASSDSLSKFKPFSSSSVPPREFNSPMAAAGRTPTTSSSSFGFGSLNSKSKTPSSSAFAPPVRRYEAKYTGPLPSHRNRSQNRNQAPSIGDFSIGDGFERMETELGGGEEQEMGIDPWSADSNERLQDQSGRRLEQSKEGGPVRRARKTNATTTSSTPIKSKSTRSIKSKTPSETPATSAPRIRTRSKETSSRAERSTSSVPGGFPGMEGIEVEAQVEKDGADEKKGGDEDETMDELDLLGPAPTPSSTSSRIKKSVSASSSKPKVSSRLKSVTTSSRSNEHFSLEIPTYPSTSKVRRAKSSNTDPVEREAEEEEEIGEIPKRRGGSRKIKKSVDVWDQVPDLPDSSSNLKISRSKRSTRADSVSASSVSESQGDEEEEEKRPSQRRSQQVEETPKRRTTRSRSVRSGLGGLEEDEDQVDKTPGVKTRSGKRTMRG